MTHKPKPYYGFDGSPFVVALIGVFGILFTGGGLALCRAPSLSLRIAALVSVLVGLLLLFVSGSHLYYVRIGKLRRRDAMISMVDWTGSEFVLDVGTGLGLLMIGAAKKLVNGRSVGLDIWDERYMKGNTYKNASENALIEGVLRWVTILRCDAREISAPDGNFDVVLSNLCLHNIPTPQGREQACREIARVLKPGGIAVICDKSNTAEYARTFAASGLSVECLPAVFDGSLRRIVKASKPR